MATKTEKLLETIGKIEIPLTPYPKELLIRSACDHYNARLQFGDFHTADPTSSDSQFIERICVNYIRHKLTSYEAQLLLTAGRVGKEDAALSIAQKIFDAIATTYPWLEREAKHQMEERQFRACR